MTLLDYAVILVVGVSVLISIMRGMVREVIALAGWIVAFVVANLYSGTVAAWLPSGIGNESARMLAAFLILFLVVLLAMGLLAMAVSRLVKSAGLSIEDRVLGAVFGLARGVLIVVVFVLMAGLTPLPRQPVWKGAMFSAPLETLAIFIRTWLPKDLSRRIRYD